ncbi:ABC transporter ATP-binding protein [Mangrovibrevibacter kandeliae]|uniref:ABC transporter ATP-binding protein n=1 Tax=Mangrovibrevibacter kandeliae TaxID=2968473 RepID=UPI00211844F4|nr:MULTISPECIES: ABC transporter ATP-binding protein [unclassified Aurantimonas]MCQ8781213.1 ABC transporter ATP-binding protein [Aurantimonas sp. CSK15Z-1]MCW4113990.1 ABC transporter ATP-binding protein [Aurantimonas sp. MSK8Z-1]
MSFLELDGLVKAYGALTVVKGVDLAVDRGTLVCLLGPSGCGKTTTLRLIAGFANASGGEVRVGGEVVSSASRNVPPEDRNMSMIFQSYALWPHMTVFQNVAYGLKLRRLPATEIKERVGRILESTHLGPLAGRYPSELSGGQQQRVSLARALVVEPQILLLDEPLSNLDANLREEMRFEIRRLHDQFRYTTVYVTHDQSEAMTTADLIVVMNAGRIEQCGTPEDIYERPETEFVARFIGGTNILKGRSDGSDTVVCADGVVLRCGSGRVSPGGETAVSIRHHDIRIGTTPPAGDGSNQASGVVERQIYLGSHRDYLVKLSGGERVRAVAPVNVAIPVGQQVWLHFPPEHCRALTH